MPLQQSPQPDARKPHPTVAVVIVTYSSAPVIALCLDALEKQKRAPDLVVIVDNCSPDPGYLDALHTTLPLQLVRNPRNDGFCGGNNLGYSFARDHDLVLFLNPDAFLREDFLERALAWMALPAHQDVGVLTGTLLGYDVTGRAPTGLIDSTGIFPTWYGRWYDRDQGSKLNSRINGPAVEAVPAVCGALMLCRSRALAEVGGREANVFDPDFFMYKEDIDLSLRLRASGWKLIYFPLLVCYHARGWQGRLAMSPVAKRRSARNDLRISLRHRPAGLPFALLKLGYVLLLERNFTKIALGFRRHGRERRVERND